MSLTLRLVLAIAGVLTAGFAALGLAAVQITGAAVERGLERRIDFTVRAISARRDFFVLEAPLRGEEFRRLADLSGFEIVVCGEGAREVGGTSLAPREAERVLREAPESERFTILLGGVEHLGARVKAGGRTVFLLSPAAPVERAKREARRPILLVCGVGLLAAIAVGAVLAGTVTRPLRRLAERASRVREGRLDVRIPRGGGREVAHLARAFEEMLAGLARYREELVRKEKMATLGRFSAAVAHELRNPLSSIRMTLQMLRREAPEELAGEFSLLLSEMARLDHSVEELLFHAGTPRYALKVADLREVVAETVRVLRPLASHLGVTLEEEVPEVEVAVRADAAKLRQALMNLVLNGIQASPEGETVAASLRREDGEAVFEVRDRGPGIPEEVRGREFEPFVSGREGGTGLGLAVAKAIAEAHGGSVDHERSGGATVFRLRVPEGG